jgi:hypothetical protein
VSLPSFDEILDLAVMGAGVGTASMVTGYVGKILPGVSEDVGAIVAGGLMYSFGSRVHPMVAKYGAGVLLAGVGGLVKGIMGQSGLGGLNSNPNPNPTNNYTSLGDLAKAESMKTVTTGVVVS